MGIGENGSKTRIIWALLAIIQSIVTAWVWQVSSKAARVDVLEANIINLKETVTRMDSIIEQLLKERR